MAFSRGCRRKKAISFRRSNWHYFAIENLLHRISELLYVLGWDHVQTIDSLLRKGGFRGSITTDFRASLRVVRFQSDKLTVSHAEYIAHKQQRAGMQQQQQLHNGVDHSVFASSSSSTTTNGYTSNGNYCPPPAKRRGLFPSFGGGSSSSSTRTNGYSSSRDRSPQNRPPI